ncbi:dephospho-CoA kinase [bacterium]|nr:dephospho-CoA kinase [bacterium]
MARDSAPARGNTPKPSRFLRLGLTGGIASGKSEAARIFAELGLGVLDADAISREAVAPGSDGLALIRAAFGDGILTPAGELDRERMRAIAFSDPEKRAALEAIIHPRVFVAIAEGLRAFEAQGRPAGVVEAALLIEAGAREAFDAIVAVVAGRERQRERLLARSAWSPEQIEGVLAAQIDDAERKARADYVIRNDGTLDDLRVATITVWARICGEHGD